jgi:putative ABC transport system permease protein
MFSAMRGDVEEEKEEENETKDENKDVVKSLDVSMNMYNALVSKRNVNDLAEFKKYIDDASNGFGELTSAIRYTYDLNIKIYGTDLNGKTLRVNPSTVMDAMGMGNMTSVYSMYSSMPAMSMMSTDMDIFGELLDNPELLDQQYEVVAGHWPQDKSEMVFVVTEHNYVEDMALFTLGLKDQSTLKAFLKNESIEHSGKDEYDYDEILGLRFRCILDTDYYAYDANKGVWNVLDENSAQFNAVLGNGLELKIVGIVRPKPEAAATAISSTIGYTKELTRYVIEQTNNSEILKAQMADKDTDVFTGKPFADSENAENAENSAMDMSSLTPEQQAYLATLSPEEIEELRKQMAAAAVSEATYDGNLKALGYCDLTVPASISIYPKDFESKDLIEEKIKEYNAKCEAEGNEGAKISYTDFIGLMMSSISTIINAITYVLIAFVAISLVVSSIMIAIITYISVLERTKEIGILRSIGASKRDVSRVFNAETLIEGLVSGLMGVLVTVLLNIPINAAIYHFAGLKNISALPVNYGIILVLISVFLTVIAGLIPAGMAAKRDPVEALRSE